MLDITVSQWRGRGVYKDGVLEVFGVLWGRGVCKDGVLEVFCVLWGRGVCKDRVLEMFGVFGGRGVYKDEVLEEFGILRGEVCMCSDGRVFRGTDCLEGLCVRVVGCLEIRNI